MLGRSTIPILDRKNCPKTGVHSNRKPTFGAGSYGTRLPKLPILRPHQFLVLRKGWTKGAQSHLAAVAVTQHGLGVIYAFCQVTNSVGVTSCGPNKRMASVTIETRYRRCTASKTRIPTISRSLCADSALLPASRPRTQKHTLIQSSRKRHRLRAHVPSNKPPRRPGKSGARRRSSQERPCPRERYLSNKGRSRSGLA